MIAFLNGEYLPKEKMRISPDDRGFVFADGVYEMIRSYDGKLFQLDSHLERLERSLDGVRIRYGDTEKLKDVARRLIEENDLGIGDATVYIQITRGVAPRLHRFPSKEVSPTVYMCAARFHPHDDELKNGARVILVPDIRWSRCDIKSIALLPNVLARQQAAENGAGEAVFVRDGMVTEGTHTNFCGIFNGQLRTAPKSQYVLAGITREIIIGLCKTLSVPVQESSIPESSLKEADELCILGTISEVTPVIQVDDWAVRNGKPGPITKMLQRAFHEFVKDSFSDAG